MSNFNSTFDNDFDSYLNLDTTDYTSTSTSPAIQTIPSLARNPSSSSSASFFAPSRPSFTGPSYQYGIHRQQTGLPSGALANTFAVNQQLGLQYRHNSLGFVMPTDTLNTQFSSTFDEFDFLPSQQLDMADLDFDADSPSDMSSMYLNGGESSQSAPIQRIYPGIHSQQAAQAEAAQAQKQQEMARLQQQPKQIPGQRPLPTNAPTPTAAKDPHVEESISRLLSRMRQSSSVSAEESSPTNVDSSGLTRLKKEEDDMDEDERLLASEEGKKLSSKERRQLRNKVSARAFRSRRKEYIGQLEGEVAMKVQEANELRAQNRQLIEENNRLTDLTRMLLSSQAFSGFLKELSNSGLPAPTIPMVTPASASHNGQVRKDVPVHEATRQLQSQQLATVPEVNEAQGSNWTSVPSNDFQVYSVTELPQPPALDFLVLSEKTEERDSSANKDMPSLSARPAMNQSGVNTVEQKVDESVNLDEQEFDLYYESLPRCPILESDITDLISSLRKPESIAEDVPVSGEREEIDLDIESSLEKMCEQLDEISKRLEKYFS